MLLLWGRELLWHTLWEEPFTSLLGPQATRAGQRPSWQWGLPAGHVSFDPAVLGGQAAGPSGAYRAPPV